MMEIDIGYGGTITLDEDLYLTTNFDQKAGEVAIGSCTAITIEGNLSIGAGGTFTAALPIEVWQDITLNSGAGINLAGATLVLNGWADQNISLGGFTLAAVNVPNILGTISFLDGFTAAASTFTAGASIKFGAGKTFTFTNITWNGIGGSLIVLRSTVDGSSWNLVIAGGDTVAYVDVKNSYASGGGLITTTHSINRGELQLDIPERG